MLHEVEEKCRSDGQIHHEVRKLQTMLLRFSLTNSVHACGTVGGKGLFVGLLLAGD